MKYYVYNMTTKKYLHFRTLKETKEYVKDHDDEKLEYGRIVYR